MTPTESTDTKDSVVPQAPPAGNPVTSHSIPTPTSQALGHVPNSSTTHAPSLSPQVFSQNYSTGIKPSGSHKKKYILIGTVFFILLIGGSAGGLFLMNQSYEKQKAKLRESEPKATATKVTPPATPAPPVAKEKITYSELKKVTSSDSKVSFSVPSKYQLIPKNPAVQSPYLSSVTLYGDPKPNDPEDNYSFVGATVETIPAADMPKIKELVTSQLKTPNSDIYSSIRTVFAAQGTPVVNFGTPTEYKGGMNVPITSAKDIKGNEASGRLIVLFGKTNVYTITIGADTSVWNDNADLFNKIAESFVVK